jgi:hypothetical protein
MADLQVGDTGYIHEEDWECPVEVMESDCDDEYVRYKFKCIGQPTKSEYIKTPAVGGEWFATGMRGQSGYWGWYFEPMQGLKMEEDDNG